MPAYLRNKFQVFSMIFSSFRQRGVILPLSQPQNEPLKSPPRLGLHFTVLFGMKLEKNIH